MADVKSRIVVGYEKASDLARLVETLGTDAHIIPVKVTSAEEAAVNLLRIYLNSENLTSVSPVTASLERVRSDDTPSASKQHRRKRAALINPLQKKFISEYLTSNPYRSAREIADYIHTSGGPEFSKSFHNVPSLAPILHTFVDNGTLGYIRGPTTRANVVKVAFERRYAFLNIAVSDQLKGGLLNTPEEIAAMLGTKSTHVAATPAYIAYLEKGQTK